jgi:hypothetical protein
MVSLSSTLGSDLPWRYSVTRIRVVGVCMFSFYALLCLSPAINPGRGGLGVRLLGAALVGACLTLVTRAWRCGSVVADQRGLVYRSILRSRHWGWGEVDHLEGRDGRLGVAGYRRRMLWLVMRDGDAIRLTEVNLSPARSREIDWVASKLNGFRQATPE